MKKFILTIVIMLVLAISYYIFCYSFETSSYFMALKNHVKMVEAYPGPYYRIIYGTDKNLTPVYIIFIKNEKNPYMIFEKQGVSKEKAIETARKHIGNDIEKTYLLLNSDKHKENSNDELLKELKWRFYYNLQQGDYIEVDFHTGDYLGINQ